MPKLTPISGHIFENTDCLYHRNSRHGDILSLKSSVKNPLRFKKLPRGQLFQAKKCLSEARKFWASLNSGLRDQFILQMPILCELRFPSHHNYFSSFNRFLSLYSGYFFGNYYYNGDLSWLVSNQLIPIQQRAYDYPSPNPAMPGGFTIVQDYGFQSFSNFSFKNIVINLSNNNFSFDIFFDYNSFPIGQPWIINFGFGTADYKCGLVFYISLPTSSGLIPHYNAHRLIIANYHALEYMTPPAGYTVQSPFSFVGSLSKFYDLSTFSLESGKSYNITIFSVSLYGQSHLIGSCPCTVI